MRLSRRLAAALLLASFPLLAACDKNIGNTNNHITNGPPLPAVHPTSIPAASSPSTSASAG
jgi:hypothetical protein